MAEAHQDNFGFEECNGDHAGAKVAFQGVEGAYGHQATLGYFGKDVDCYHVKTFEDVMKEVHEGRADYGVLPVENSSTGIITDVYDLMHLYDNYIVGEYVVKVEHALLGLSLIHIWAAKKTSTNYRNWQISLVVLLVVQDLLWNLVGLAVHIRLASQVRS